MHGIVGGASVRWNPYSYVGGNPINRVDPDGRCFFAVVDTAVCVTAAVGAIIGAIGFGGYEYYQQHQQYGEIRNWGAVWFSAIKGVAVGGLLGATWGIAGTAWAAANPAYGSMAMGATTNIAGSILAGNYDIQDDPLHKYAGRITTNLFIDSTVGAIGGLGFYKLIPSPLAFARNYNTSLRGWENVGYMMTRRAFGAGVANAAQGGLNNFIRGHIFEQEEYRYKSFGDIANRAIVDFQWGWLVSGLADTFALGVGRFNTKQISITKLRRMDYKGDFLIPTNVNFHANPSLIDGVQRMWGTYSALNQYAPVAATVATTNTVTPILDPWITLYGEQ